MTVAGEEIESNEVLQKEVGKGDGEEKQPKVTLSKEEKDNKDESKTVVKDGLKVEKKVEVPSKKSVRLQTWSRLDQASVVLFPTPCRYRIPRFKGEVQAVQRLAELDVFKQSKVIKVTLDKAHECVRIQVIESGKELIAGSPGLREAVFLHIKPPVEPNKASVRMASSRNGINHLGTALDFNSETKADLIIIGSVAVDKKGRRLGKGEGFSDLEYALLSKLGGVAPNAPIVTVVHDLQVYDELPEEIFQPFDVPVDYIVTPTQVIKVDPPLPRPTLQWNILSNRRVNSIPIIKQLMDKEQTNGVKIELKAVDSDTEDVMRPRNNFRWRRYSRRRRDMSAPERRGPQRAAPREGSAPVVSHNSRTFRRRPRNQIRDRDYTEGRSAEGTINRRQARPPLRRMRKFGKTRFPVDFSVRVNGLTSGIRIRDLKAALIERGVRPRDISWRGTKGVALLHFSKARSNPETPVAVDDIVASLQGLKVKGDGDDGPVADLNVEPAKPITRIEVIDVAKV